METSDSEYFESADEDFSSDNEAQTKKTQNVRGTNIVKVKEKIEELSINDNLECEPIEKEVSSNKDYDNINRDLKTSDVVLGKTIACDYSESSSLQNYNKDNNNKCEDKQNVPITKSARDETSSLPQMSSKEHEKNDNKIQLDINSQPKIQKPPAVSSSGLTSETTNNKLIESSENKSKNLKNVKEKLNRPEFGIPPTVATCWEPGATNTVQPFETHPAYVKLVEDQKRTTSAAANHDKNSVTNVNTQTKRPEFGIPPARTTCWVPGTTNIARPFEPHPAYIKLMEERGKVTSATSATTSGDGNLDKSDVTNINKQTKRPTFGTPPARTTCWVSGITNIAQSFESDPAYVKLKEEREKVTSEDGDNGGSDVTNVSKQSTRPEFGVPPAKTTCWIPGGARTRNANTPFEEYPTSSELVRNQENSSNSPLSVSKEMIQDVTNVDNVNQPICSKQAEQSVQETEESMWDHEDDWNEFDMPAKQNDRLIKSKEGLISQSQKDIDEVEENMWEEDDWEPVESNTQHQNTEKINVTSQSNKEKSSWSNWSSWGLSSVISTATTLTTQVSQGITNVLETGIGAPDPAELARINKLEKEKINEAALLSNEELPPEKPILGFGLGNLVQGVTKLVESTGTKVISGGLDTLETIGKKTMEVLQENDPGLKKKRAFLKLDDNKPILSQILREAKEKAEEENKELEKKHFARKANYETLFDDHQGLVHLEALEMLSKQCDIKLQSLLESTSSDVLNDIQETLDQVKELCELPEEEDEETLSMDEIKERLETAVSEINVKITYNRLLTTWQEVEDWLAKLNLKICNKNELHQQAIESLAQLTAIAVEQFHKAGELLLIKDHRSTADEADSLVQLTATLTSLIGIVAARFSEKLNLAVAEGADKEEVNSLITNVFFEAANSSSYIQDAFQLLIPVLQVGAV